MYLMNFSLWIYTQEWDCWIIFNTFTYDYSLQLYIKTKSIREMSGEILLIHLSNLNKKQENFFKEKNTYGHQSVCVATEGPHVTDE